MGPSVEMTRWTKQTPRIGRNIICRDEGQTVFLQRYINNRLPKADSSMYGTKLFQQCHLQINEGETVTIMLQFF